MVDVCTSLECRRAHCVECDQHECSCGAPRYGHAIILEPVLDERGRRIGGKASDVDRERWNAPPVHVAPRSAPAFELEPLELGELTEQLETVVYMDSTLELEFRVFHEADPAKATKLANYVIEQAAAGSLHNPAGFLRSRIRAT